MKLTKVRGVLIGARAINLDDEVFLISSTGVGIRTPAKSISRQRRDATGVKVQAVKEGLAAFAVVQPDVEDEN